MKYTNMQRDRDGAASATWKYLEPGAAQCSGAEPLGIRDIAYTLMDTFFPDFPGIAGQDFTTYKDN